MGEWMARGWRALGRSSLRSSRTVVIELVENPVTAAAQVPSTMPRHRQPWQLRESGGLDSATAETTLDELGVDVTTVIEEDDESESEDEGEGEQEPRLTLGERRAASLSRAPSAVVNVLIAAALEESHSMTNEL